MTDPVTSPEQWIDREIVLDLSSRFVVAGRLTAIGDRFYALDDADMHDLQDSSTTREAYVLETRRHGIRANRRRLLVQRADVVGISPLDDVIE